MEMLVEALGDVAATMPTIRSTIFLVVDATMQAVAHATQNARLAAFVVAGGAHHPWVARKLEPLGPWGLTGIGVDAEYQTDCALLPSVAG